MKGFRTVLAAGLLGAAAFGAASAAQAQGEVNLYSSRHYEVDAQLYDTFTKETGIKVNVVQAGGSELIQRIAREGKNSPADIFFTADAGVIGQAHLRGLLQPVKSAALEEGIPANLREPGGHWFGFTMRARVIMYDKTRVKPTELSTYEALADPKWKGEILIRSSNNSYNQSLVASLIDALGPEKAEQWAKGIVANMARPPKGGDRDQITAMLAGEGELAIANTYYLGQLIHEGKPGQYDKVGVFFPNQDGRGTHVNVSGGGVTKYAPNRDNAVKLLEFLITPEAQKIFAEGNFEYPVRPGVQVSSVVKSFGDFKADKLNVSVLAKNNADAVRLMDRAGWK